MLVSARLLTGGGTHHVTHRVCERVSAAPGLSARARLAAHASSVTLITRLAITAACDMARCPGNQQLGSSVRDVWSEGIQGWNQDLAKGPTPHGGVKFENFDAAPAVRSVFPKFPRHTLRNGTCSKQRVALRGNERSSLDGRVLEC